MWSQKPPQPLLERGVRKKLSVGSTAYHPTASTPTPTANTHLSPPHPTCRPSPHYVH
ncbi:hypothetical protein K491DRAFT_686247 [Lophiostoma macrostomum CBS 122681]|uniref:Uncharacterized protein n=1 Tax=Lophiostoma macrostomum CBS 122681 TaxID=1314788 RepID=A0A6A6TSS4_9PLEO|nr:hypothetical protein K491DRAFT_686247 [Lophiostoma macrostomum CBS 122681]